MLVDAVATFPHYQDHLGPIWRALPRELRGAVHQLGDLNVPAGRLALVAGWKDARVLDMHRIPFIYVEHGSGQTYAGDAKASVRNHPSYSGGGGVLFNNVKGYISPSREVAGRWKNAPACAVGCPKMDEYHRLKPTDPEAICFTFHWPGTMCPENGTAFGHYEVWLADIALNLRLLGHRVYGHAHPRWDGILDRTFAQAGMTMLKTDRDVFNTAQMLIADNTSLIAEHAMLGRPVALLNAPWYRRDVEHGMRFWDWPKRVLTFDDPKELMDWKPWLADPRHRAASKALARDVYETTDGEASRIAAAFVTDIALGL